VRRSEDFHSRLGNLLLTVTDAANQGNGTQESTTKSRLIIATTTLHHGVCSSGSNLGFNKNRCELGFRDFESVLFDRFRSLDITNRVLGSIPVFGNLLRCAYACGNGQTSLWSAVMRRASDTVRPGGQPGWRRCGAISARGTSTNLRWSMRG
jgi:hypothetical protein